MSVQIPYQPASTIVQPRVRVVQTPPLQGVPLQGAPLQGVPYIQQGNVISPRRGYPPNNGYLVTPDQCHPGNQVFHCPITLYIIIVIVFLIINLWALFVAPRTTNSGRNIGTSELWVAGIIGVIVYLVLAVAFWWAIYEHCRSCSTGRSWTVFLMAILMPFVIAVITGVVMGSILDIGFLWTANKEPNKEEDSF